MHPLRVGRTSAPSIGRAVDPTSRRPVSSYVDGVSEEDLNEKVGFFRLVCRAIVFFGYAGGILILMVWDSAVKRTRARVCSTRSRWDRFWFRLTTHIDCVSCRKRLHRAPLPLPRRILGGWIPWRGWVRWISHTYCAACRERMMKEFRDGEERHELH